MTLQEFTGFKTGDLIACFGADLTSRAISTITGCIWAPSGLRWGPSHVAIIGEQDQQPIWVESTTLCPHPCLIRKELVAGPQAHPPQLRMADYLAAGGRIDIYRPTPLNRFTGHESALLSRLLMEECVSANLPYDLTGALLSGSRYLPRSRWFPAADLTAFFCSELVAAVLMRMGRLNRQNPARFHPGRLLRTLVQEGTYLRLASRTHR